MIFGTKESTKKHDLEHDLWHEGEHQKARSRARLLARRRAPKSTIFGRRKSTKKHDLEHDLLHEGKHRKARFVARRKTLKTTFAQNIKKSFFWLLQLLGRTQPIYIYIHIYIYIPLKPMVTPFKVKRNQTAMIPLPPWCINSRCSWGWPPQKRDRKVMWPLF